MISRSKFNALVWRMVRAEIADSWKGTRDPADIPRIEQNVKVARKRYNDALDELYDLARKGAAS